MTDPILLVILPAVMVGVLGAVYLWSADRSRRSRAWRLLELLLGIRR